MKIPHKLVENLLNTLCNFTNEEFTVLSSFVTSRIRSSHLDPFIDAAEHVRDYVNRKTARHSFKDDSNCENCSCFGPTEEQFPCIPFDPEGLFVQGQVNKEGDWEPMISIPVSEYEELVEKAAMYDGLCE